LLVGSNSGRPKIERCLQHVKDSFASTALSLREGSKPDQAHASSNTFACIYWSNYASLEKLSRQMQQS